MARLSAGRVGSPNTRMDFIVLDELGYLPFAKSGGQLLFHLVSWLYERTSIIATTNSPLVNCRASSVMPR
jgi:DNA replication protein DnaC